MPLSLTSSVCPNTANTAPGPLALRICAPWGCSCSASVPPGRISPPSARIRAVLLPKARSAREAGTGADVRGAATRLRVWGWVSRALPWEHRERPRPRSWPFRCRPQPNRSSCRRRLWPKRRWLARAGQERPRGLGDAGREAPRVRPPGRERGFPVPGLMIKPQRSRRGWLGRLSDAKEFGGSALSAGLRCGEPRGPGGAVTSPGLGTPWPR